jgi:hypothetical protein
MKQVSRQQKIMEKLSQQRKATKSSNPSLAPQERETEFNMKKQGNVSPPKLNDSTIQNLNASEVDEISNNELKRTWIRMINKIKVDM